MGECVWERQVFTGIFADRYGAKLSFIVGSILSLLSDGLLFWAYDPSFFYAISLITGVSVTFFSGADEALLYESLKESGEEKSMDKAMGIIQSAQFVVTILLALIFLLRLVRTVRYPIYSQLSNELIPSKVRATTISLLSILDSVCDIVIFISLSGVALFGFTELFMISAVIALIGSLVPIKSAPEVKNTV